jgi:hypothetical protein
MILTSTDITLRATTVSGTKAITVPTTYKNNTVTINYIATASDSKQHKGSFVLLVTAATVAPPIGPPKVTFTITPEYNPTLKPIAVGSRFTIAWTASDTTTLKLTGLGLNTTAVNGSQTVTAPPKPGTYYITVVAVGPTGKKNSTTEMFTVGKATVVVPPVVEPVIQLQFNPSSFTLGSASANTSTLTWQVTNADSIMLTSSPLLAINSTSTSGSRTITAPTVPGAYNVTITVPRTTGTAKTAQATFTVLDPVTLKLISTQGYQVPDCAVGSPYQYEYTASGGVPPYKFTIDEKFGILPYGLTMNSAGAITGTPIATQKTTASFTVVLTDSMNKTDRLDGSIQITATGVPKLQFVGWPSNMQLPDSKVSGDYRWRLTAEGGIAPYSFSIDANYPLPAGLTLSTTGLITGISTVATDPARPLGLNLVIYVTDAAGTRAGGDFFIRVRTN